MHYLALCSIAKDEDPFIKEWLAYHALLGVEHFYIYDNCSKRPIRDLLRGFADESRVTVRRIKGEAMQLPAYNDCLKSFGASSRWIGFIDIDEFALPVQDDDLRPLLAEYEQYGGLAAAWRLFNSSGHLGRPFGPVIKNYTEAFTPPRSFQNKCFVQPARTLVAQNPHYFSYAEAYYCVNEDHYPISPFCEPSFSNGKKLRINHYFVRSQQDFEEKLKRGRGDSARPEMRYDMVMFYNALAQPYAEDKSIQRFLPALREALERDSLPEPFLVTPPGADYERLMELALGLADAGQYGKAQAFLCGFDDEARQKADFWTLRALLAANSGNLERADIFIRESLKREASVTGYKQLEKQFRAMGKSELADGVEVILRSFPATFK